MSENANAESISIQINNADSTNGAGGGILDRVFDIGFKLLIPLVLILLLGAIVVFIVYILPLLESALGFGEDVVEGSITSGNLFSGITSAILGVVLGRIKD